MSIKDLEKKYSDFINVDRERIYYPFSLISVNKVVGGQGLLGGRAYQFVGMKSSGKTTLACDVIANAQRLYDVECAVLDSEGTFDLEYARYLGVNTEKLAVVTADTAEQLLDIGEDAIRSYGVKVLVLDSLSNIVPKDEKDKTMDDNAKMAASAGLLTRWFKRMTYALLSTNSILILINQFRADMSMSRSDKKPSGPYALPHFVSATLQLARTKNGENDSEVEIFVEKNKMGGKERQRSTITMEYGKGFDYKGDVLRLARELGIVEYKKPWYYYPSKENATHKASGENNFCEIMPLEEIREKVLAYEKNS